MEKFNQIFRKDRKIFGGGILIYTANDVTAKRRSDLEFDDDEMIWIQLQKNNTKYILGVLHRPQGTDVHLVFGTDLDTHSIVILKLRQIYLSLETSISICYQQTQINFEIFYPNIYKI